MNSGQNHTNENSRHQPAGLAVAHRLRYALARLRLRLSPLGSRIRWLGFWLEEELFPNADKVREESLTLTPRADGQLAVTETNSGKGVSLCDCHEVCDFLGRLGIAALRVDTRLESNQIEDVMALLLAYRRELTSRHDCVHVAPLLSALGSDEGLHFNCMDIRLQDGLLSMQYSYCVTKLSLAVRWFERKHRHFADHRALFHAAPRYGLLAAAVAGAVLLGYLLTQSLTLLVMATIVEAVLLFTAVYVFMRGMGSIEYDNEESAFRLAQAHARVSQYARRIRHDLDLARAVQQNLLPDQARMPLPDRIEWSAHFDPETEVGGDYFDAAALGPHKAAFVFADVSGHGMPAALITVIVKMAFQTWIQTGWPPTDFVRYVNRDLCQFTPEGSFVVLIAAVYDAQQGQVTFVNAGHSPEPIWLPADSAQTAQLLPQIGSMLLGIEMDIEITETTHPLRPGDTLLLATDGFTEAQNAEGELFGRDRLLHCLTTRRNESLETLVSSLVNSTTDFTAGADQTDDRTVLALRIRPPTKS